MPCLIPLQFRSSIHRHASAISPIKSQFGGFVRRDDPIAFPFTLLRSLCSANQVREFTRKTPSSLTGSSRLPAQKREENHNHPGNYLSSLTAGASSNLVHQIYRTFLTLNDLSLERFAVQSEGPSEFGMDSPKTQNKRICREQLGTLSMLLVPYHVYFFCRSTIHPSLSERSDIDRLPFQLHFTSVPFCRVFSTFFVPVPLLFALFIPHALSPIRESERTGDLERFRHLNRISASQPTAHLYKGRDVREHSLAFACSITCCDREITGPVNG